MQEPGQHRQNGGRTNGAEIQDQFAGGTQGQRLQYEQDQEGKAHGRGYVAKSPRWKAYLLGKHRALLRYAELPAGGYIGVCAGQR